MVVDKHLKELALTNRRVIIPDLGAFLSKEGDGDEKNLIFSSFLKYNDGFLEKQLADKEKLSQIEASEEVKKFVGEVTKTLRAKHNYVIDGFGFFHMDERGSIAFSPQDTEIATKPVEEKPVVIATAPSTPTEAKPAATVSAVPPKAEQPKVEQPVVKPLTPQQTAPVTPPPGKPTQTQQTPPKQQSPKKSSNNGLLITIVILLVVIIILLLLYFMAPSIKEKVNSMFGIKSTTTEQVVTPPAVQQSADTIPAIDSTQIDTVKVIEPVKEEVTTPKSVSTYGSNYYVIVGTFQEKSNADKMYKRCIADGYDAELLPKMGALYPVSIFNSPSKAECTKVMREAQRKYGDAWIFKSRRH
ncbi:MAG: SPOR domain-containing protein [Prevotellaceae bacterium]|jgi:nucleoid DNA-binding protein|nr:SPOR domain-containing protein [Prevotellaceae bacterium]